MNTFEEEATRYELVEHLKSQVKHYAAQAEDTKQYNEKQREFFKEHIGRLEDEIAEKSTFTLESAIEELGHCYEVGTRIRHSIAKYTSDDDDTDYTPIHDAYNSWHMSVYFVFLYCEDIGDHYFSIFLNAFNRRRVIPSTEERIAQILGDMPPDPQNDFEALNFGIDKLEEIIFRLEEKQNLHTRQQIAKQEHDNRDRYWLKYDDVSGKLTLNDHILLGTARLDSPSDKLFTQVSAHPNELIEIQDVTATQITAALRDFGIKGNLKKLFFPRTSKGKVFFRPKVTNLEFIEEELDDLNLQDIMRNNEK